MQTYYLIQFWRLEVLNEYQGDKIKSQQNWFLLEDLREDLFLAASSFWRLQHSSPAGYITPIFASVATSLSHYLCLIRAL